MNTIALLLLLNFTPPDSQILVREETIVLYNGMPTELVHQHLWFYNPTTDTTQGIVFERICERCYRHEKIIALFSDRIEDAKKKWEVLLKSTK